MMLTLHAHAKINWALDILATRENGYHELDMLMQSVSLYDTLTVCEDNDLLLYTDGRPDPYAEKNLVMRAARLLQETAGCRRGARMELTKRIPAMAGLGGGSADCAAALIALNEMWELGLTKDRLFDLGFSLGADVPFCLAGGLRRVGGLGEIMRELPSEHAPHMLLVMPDGGLSTGAVFGGYDRMEHTQPPVDMEACERALLAGDWRALNACAGNVLTAPAMQVSAAVGPTIGRLYAEGAVLARMSGSGSAVFGVFEDAAAVDRAHAALKGGYVFCERITAHREGVSREKGS